MNAPFPHLYCCGHKVEATRVSTTCEGSRFLSAVCPVCRNLVIREFPFLCVGIPPSHSRGHLAAAPA